MFLRVAILALEHSLVYRVLGYEESTGMGIKQRQRKE